MLVVDTNVLIAAANRDVDFHETCRRAVERCRTSVSPWYVSWPICYEFLRVCTHPNVLPRPWSLRSAWNFIESVLVSPRAGVLLPTDRHREMLIQVMTEIPHLAGNIWHDVHTVVLMREHGIREIYTRDTDFHRFPFLKVIDPVAANL
jgi:toxin-antitoxin system PIN domain toxin